MFFYRVNGVFTNDCLKLTFQQAFVVVQVVVSGVEVCLLLLNCFLFLINDVLIEVPVANLFVKLVDLVTHLLHT